MALESVSLSLIVWGIVITLAIITFGPLLLRMTRLRKYKLFSASELHFSIRFTRMVSFVFLIAILVETFNGMLFGVGIIDVRAVDMTWYLSKIFFIVAFAALIFLPRHVFSFTKVRELRKIKKDVFEIKGRASAKIVDSVDWDILNVVKTQGGEIENIRDKLHWLDENDFEERLNKLHVLNYIKFSGHDVCLTPDALDVLNTPPLLFSSNIEDKTVINKLIEIRVMMRKEDANGVLNESTKLLEWVLKNKIKEKIPHKDKMKSGKPIEAATLGELIGEAREYKITSIFEDSVLTAVNDIRKSVHSRDG